VSFSGGPLGSALEFYSSFCAACEGDIKFHEPEAQSLYRSIPDAQYRTFLTELGIARLGELPVPLVTTFGFSAHLLAYKESWQIYRDCDGGIPPGFLASRLFVDIIRAMSSGALDFYRYVRGLGLRVLGVMAPQLVPATCEQAIFMSGQEIVAQAVDELGVEVIDIRARTTDEHGRQRPEFCEPGSPVHGNLAFGRLIVDELLAQGL
jgi:hypothetical protein